MVGVKYRAYLVMPVVEVSAGEMVRSCRLALTGVYVTVDVVGCQIVN